MFSPDFGMFEANEDTNLFWFKRKTMEFPINYELLGTIVGIAVYNNLQIDLPLAPVIYKLLLGEKPSLADLRIWQPEVAKSMKYILDYDDESPLEIALEQTFTVDFQQFGAMQTVDLVENGSQLYVTKDNRNEYVRKYIEYEFEAQCENPLLSFKRGFERLCDTRLIKELLDEYELERTICGDQQLDFTELRESAKYCSGYSRDCKEMHWFWEIVLNEWDDVKRRSLLTFSTGTDRAPVSGLKNMKFYIIMDGKEELKLPTSHTCFNQLLIPAYPSKEILREKLEMAILNATGFGMV
jgi:hypothetical protein